ncbi:MAG: DNA polymerase/3'-5' exonuclease PolX [Chthoniobacterales bacterium]|nr:DNA polymerase/3'-5' exonuclease PolX [Chthoniobacterales bacterium]
MCETLGKIAKLLELNGENPFKIRAYTNAAHALEIAPLSQEELLSSEKLEQILGIGKAIAQKIVQLASTGNLPLLNDLQAKFPESLMRLFEVPGLGSKKIKVLFEQLGIADLPALEAACKDGRVAALPGFGEKTAQNILKGLASLAAANTSFLLSSALNTVLPLLDALRESGTVTFAEPAGSLRRRKETVRDIDIICSTKKPADAIAAFLSLAPKRETLAHGSTKASVILDTGIQCDLRVVAPNEFPFAIAYFTGSKEHNVAIRSLCLERGWSLNEYRLSTLENTNHHPLPEVNEEADLHRALGLDYIPPELRENTGEIEAAREKRLPKLLELQHLRGVLHNHTNWSDGKNSLEEMATAAAELGLDYLGIADHSKSSVQARGLSEARLREQVARIREFNANPNRPITLLAGIECDILKDGSLDFPDDLLADLDYVVASIHSAFQMTESEMTQRIIRAICHPLVTILAHPTGRLLLKRDPYPVNLSAVIEAAAETGTLIELNANPRRLDLDWRWWPLAKSKGVLCSINPDAHSTDGFNDLYFGVAIARKGWLEKHNVLNTLPLDKLFKFLSLPKSHRRSTPLQTL